MKGVTKLIVFAAILAIAVTIGGAAISFGAVAEDATEIHEKNLTLADGDEATVNVTFAEDNATAELSLEVVHNDSVIDTANETLSGNEGDTETWTREADFDAYDLEVDETVEYRIEVEADEGAIESVEFDSTYAGSGAAAWIQENPTGTLVAIVLIAIGGILLGQNTSNGNGRRRR